MKDINFPQDFYLDDVGVWRLKKEKLAELEKPKPLTNEEWLRQASTEELEKMFEKAQDYGATCSNGDKDKCSYCGCPWCEMGFSTWLKEKHK